jgi:hypothetical protein
MVHNIIKNNMRVLYRSERMHRLFQKPTMAAYRRDRNLGDILIRGKLNKIQKQFDRGFGCDKQCRVCDVLTQQDSIHATRSRKALELNTQEYGCKTRNVIYAIIMLFIMCKAGLCWSDGKVAGRTDKRTPGRCSSKKINPRVGTF